MKKKDDFSFIFLWIIIPAAAITVIFLNRKKNNTYIYSDDIHFLSLSCPPERMIRNNITWIFDGVYAKEGRTFVTYHSENPLPQSGGVLEIEISYEICSNWQQC